MWLPLVGIIAITVAVVFACVLCGIMRNDNTGTAKELRVFFFLAALIYFGGCYGIYSAAAGS